MPKLWAQCLTILKRELPPQQFATWIKPLTAIQDGDALQVVAPSTHVLRWVQGNAAELISHAATEAHGAPITLEWQVAAEAAPAMARAVESGDRNERSDDHRLNTGFTFSSFVSGKANQLAYAAAMQVAENPGSAYNPLFIYGGTGLGKTHLLHALGNQVLAHNPKARVRYIHTEQFVTDVVNAYQNKAFDTLKKHYRTLDLLLIDDIQFFVGKTRSQEEFFYTFNALFESNKQVVMTSDAFPREIQGIEERLKSRFGWGLTVAVEPPELEMRVAILLQKAAAEKVKLDEQVAFFIAQNVRSNVRELEGALKRVLAFSRFNGTPITLGNTKDALKDLLAAVTRQVSIENIQKTVADFYKMKVQDMYSKKRFRSIARPRQVAMSLAKELTQQSLPEIGDAFGGRDHTTVLHAVRKMQELRANDQNFAREYEQLHQLLTR